MILINRKMTEDLAKNILSWKYEKPYDFYNNELTDESLNELLDGSYYALIDNDNCLFGFFCVGKSAQVPKGNEYGVYEDECIDIGLGMDPNLVGKGNGFAFCTYILNFVQEKNKGIPIRLTVAKFNERAIHLYEKLGFKEDRKFSTENADFITMIKER